MSEQITQVLLDKIAHSIQSKDDKLDKVIEALLKSGYDGIQTDDVGNTPLMYAIIYNLKEMTQRLLNHFKDIDINDTIFSKPLHIDDEIGNSIFYSKKYADSNLIKIVNKRDQNNKSALDHAVQHKNYDLACMLLLHGANISSLSIEQQKDLLLYSSEITHNAYQREHELRPIVGLLAIKVPEAVKNYSDNYEYPRLLSYFCLHAHTKVVAALLESIEDRQRKIKIINQNDNGINSFSRVNNAYVELSDYDHLQTIKYLFEQGAGTMNDINLTLQSASSRGHLETFKYLVTKADKVCFNTYIGLATIDNCINIIEYIWNYYKDYTINQRGDTALHYAAWRGGLASIKYLCEHGADVNAINKAGETPLDYALEYSRSKDIIKYLALQCGAYTRSQHMSPQLRDILQANLENVNITDMCGNSLLHKAVESEKVILVKHLCSQGADINAQNQLGETPLHLSVRNTKSDITKFLLQRGVVYDICTSDNKTALNYSNRNNLIILHTINELFHSTNLLQDIKKYIINQYIDEYDPGNPMIYFMKTKNTQGWTLLHKAVSINDKDATSFLIGYDKTYRSMNTKLFEYASNYCPIDVSGQDFEGNSPLHLSAKNGNVEISDILIKEGANLNVVNNSGHTPMYIAAKNKHQNCVKLLVQQFQQANLLHSPEGI